jgi:HPt (histidine-containing phosphotransfer) domain-containing protein
MAQAAFRDRHAPEAAIERAHLARMTFGEAALERELLELFDRQAELLVARIAQSDPAAVAALAHTLKGSAVGVGANEVAAAAAAIEQAPTPERRAALAAAVARARAEIAVILR